MYSFRLNLLAVVASFLFLNFPIVDIDGKFKVADYLSVEIDLQSNKMVSCTLDDKSLNASEALILLWYNTTSSAQHVKIHAYGNRWNMHPNITELMRNSELVGFIIKTRWIFHHEFSKYSHLFPGINAKGLFAATVLHSLDLTFMEHNDLEDPLWLDVNDPRFGKMAELGRIARFGSVPRVSGYFECSHEIRGQRDCQLH